MNDVIKIKNLSFSYPDRIDALKDINLSVYEGESVGIIGPNGAGKSTLLLCLNGILRGMGKIIIDGIELNDKNIFSIRKKVGLVFQDPDDQLFNPTVCDDVAFGPIQMDYSKEEVERRVKYALYNVDMAGFSKRMSGHLSFGEKKRIALATVLSMEPKILALDEPTSNLDPKGRRDFIELLKTMGVTKIIATHDLEMVLDLCNKVIILDRGENISCGNTMDILTNKELLENHNLLLPLSLVTIAG